ncbi:DUF4339 domain-containing protein [Parasegetibacter sp. NRK P23]|uniref:DUF4339 domain-containing protein n=1 Tax=Parasegetibacter sp. NRK P23 TaxID=2942999 RepID=UPI00204397EB|nr:DUF4339 domain-containing protein [Parasegetibacter sp. NRK P23]MCM5528224.1 DUF4339 domain-containing protein [Parasegetibacter sp. NRK P23]
MKTYFLHDGNIESGPYAREELKGKLERHTLIWKPGLKNWTPANQLDELKEMVAADTFGCAETVNKAPESSLHPPLNGTFRVAVFVLFLLITLCYVVKASV